jgi:hypothetical protein
LSIFITSKSKKQTAKSLVFFYSIFSGAHILENAVELNLYFPAIYIYQQRYTGLFQPLYTALLHWRSTRRGFSNKIGDKLAISSVHPLVPLLRSVASPLIAATSDSKLKLKDIVAKSLDYSSVHL